jgi:hypothetical protein
VKELTWSHFENVVAWFSDYRRGFGLVVGFVEHLQLVTTSKYYALTVLHTSQISIGHTRSSQSVTVFTSRCLAAAFDGGRSPSSGFPNCPRPQLPTPLGNSSQQPQQLSNSLTHQPTDCNKSTSKLLYDWRFTANRFVLRPTPWGSTTRDFFLHITSRHGSRRKHRSSVAVQFLPWKHACLRSCYLVAAVLQLLISRSLSSSGSACHSSSHAVVM